MRRLVYKGSVYVSAPISRRGILNMCVNFTAEPR
jgi:hypothetical protein